MVNLLVFARVSGFSFIIIILDTNCKRVSRKTTKDTGLKLHTIAIDISAQIWFNLFVTLTFDLGLYRFKVTFYILASGSFAAGQNITIFLHKVELIRGHIILQ